MVIDTDCPDPVAMQRQRALVALLANAPLCRRLLIGRWGLEPLLVRMLMAKHSGDGEAENEGSKDGSKDSKDSDAKKKQQKSLLPAKIAFVEAFVRLPWQPHLTTSPWHIDADRPTSSLVHGFTRASRLSIRRWTSSRVS